MSLMLALALVAQPGADLDCLNAVNLSRSALTYVARTSLDNNGPDAVRHRYRANPGVTAFHLPLSEFHHDVWTEWGGGSAFRFYVSGTEAQLQQALVSRHGWSCIAGALSCTFDPGAGRANVTVGVARDQEGGLFIVCSGVRQNLPADRGSPPA